MNYKKEWLKKLIELFRKEYQKLSPTEKEYISGFYDFNPNCQVELIQFSDPNFQLLLVTHFEDENDTEFFIHDPIPMKSMHDKLENILNSKRWDKIVPFETASKYYISPDQIQSQYRSYLKHSLIQLYQDPNNQFKRKPNNKNEVISKSLIIPVDNFRDFIWLISGEITAIEQSKIVEKIITEAKHELKENISSQKEENIFIKGYATYFYPPIWIDDLPDFRHQATKSTQEHKKRVLSIEYKGSKLMLYKDGNIAIVEEDKSTALNKLNDIMSVSTLKSFTAYAVRENDLENISLDPQTLKIMGVSGGEYSLRLILQLERMGMSSITYPLSYRKKIAHETIEEIIHHCTKINDENLWNLLKLYLESYTHFREKEYSPSFILSWVIIETHIKDIWREYLHKKGYSKTRISDLLNSSNWTISHIIETLYLGNEINSEDYRVYSELRKKRNDLVHEGISVNSDDVKKSLMTSLSILKKLLP